MSKEQTHSCREIITLNIGGFGINIGQSILEHYCVEHGISINGDKEEDKTNYHVDATQISFKETMSGKHIARSLFIDLDPYSINMLKYMYKYSNILQDDYLIAGKFGSHHNFVTAHYSHGKEYIDTFNNKMRLMTEECDNFQGIIINNSISGGTGSGLGALCLERVAVDYRKKPKIGFHVFLDDKKSITPLEIYNALMSIHWLLDHTEASIILDNVQLNTICKHQLQIKTPRYKHYNGLCNKLISNITASWRFGLREDINSFCHDFSPYPRLHFLMASLAPILSKTQNDNTFKDNIQSLTNKCTMKNNFFHHCNDFEAEQDWYMALSFNYRGIGIDKYMYNANRSMDFLKKNRRIRFLEWCNDSTSIKYINDSIISLVSLPTDDIYCGVEQVTMVGNNTCISRLLSERIAKKYDLMRSQRAYLYWNVSEAPDGELPEARENLGFLEKDYLDVQSDYFSDDESDEY